MLAEPAGDIDILQLLLRLWHRKLLLLAFIIAGIGGAMVYIANAQYKYTAELTVTPADQASSKVPSSVSNLGSLVGVDLGGQGGSSFAIFADTVQSYPTAEAVARDQKIMRTIYSGQWDERLQQWREPQSFVKSLSKTVKALIGAPSEPWRRPTAVELRNHIREYVVVTEDKKKSILTFRYDHRDPVFAAAFLGAIINASDDFLRMKSLQRSSTYIGYLERRLAEVQIAEYRNLLAQSLVGYENKRMMASSEASFVADQFGDVWVSSRPSTPVPLLVLAIGFTAAITAWLVYVLIFESLFAVVRARRKRALATPSTGV